MKISVILPAYNAERFIRQSIESVLGQDTRETFELIVVDDCSTDGTADILRSYGNDERIRVYRTERNGGYPTAMNLGLSHARGKYISRMDADDVMNPALLRLTHDFHEVLGEDVAFVSSKRYWISYAGKPYHKDYDAGQDHQREYWEDLIDRKRNFTDVGSLYLRSLAEAIGGYNTYERSGMDVDFWLRIMEHTGKPCLTLCHPLVGKRLLPDSIIFRPNTTNANNIPRELALYRKNQGLPAGYRPTSDWLEKTRRNFPENKAVRQKVSMPVDIAMINLWLRDYRGFLAFLRLSLSRNPGHTMKILLRHGIFGWYHDFNDGAPNLAPVAMRVSAGRGPDKTVGGDQDKAKPLSRQETRDMATS
jgi:glycosyltransferase involved in cell wall biosynthesis